MIYGSRGGDRYTISADVALLMETFGPSRFEPRKWRSVAIGSTEAAAAELHALGTVVRVVVFPPEKLTVATIAVSAELRRLDLEVSRFRPDSELSRLVKHGAGLYLVSAGLAEALGIALSAARWTEGRVDPTVGASLSALGYDRDFVEISDGEGAIAVAARGWQSVRIEGRVLKLPNDVELDLGATAKGLGADRAALAAFRAIGREGGVLVSLGGDLAVAGARPRDGWPVIVAESLEADERTNQLVRLHRGALATSSTTVRRWRAAGRELHHIVDPRTGLPIDGPWRTASVAARSCWRANAASTAAIVAGERAEEWLRTTGLPARLVRNDGSNVVLNGWPLEPEGSVSLGLPHADTIPLERAS